MTVAFQVRDRVRDNGDGGDSKRLLSEGVFVKFSRVRHQPQTHTTARGQAPAAQRSASCTVMHVSLTWSPVFRESQEILLLNTLAGMSSAHQLWPALLIILSSNYLDSENLIRVLRYL